MILLWGWPARLCNLTLRRFLATIDFCRERWRKRTYQEELIVMNFFSAAEAIYVLLLPLSAREITSNDNRSIIFDGQIRRQSGMLMADIEAAQKVIQDDAIQHIAEHAIFDILINIGIVVDFNDHRTLGRHLHIYPVQAVPNQIGRLHGIAE